LKEKSMLDTGYRILDKKMMIRRNPVSLSSIEDPVSRIVAKKIAYAI